MHRKVGRSGWGPPNTQHLGPTIGVLLYLLDHRSTQLSSRASVLYFDAASPSKFYTCFSEHKSLCDWSRFQNPGDSSQDACILIWDVPVTVRHPPSQMESSLRGEGAGPWIFKSHLVVIRYVSDLVLLFSNSSIVTSWSPTKCQALCSPFYTHCFFLSSEQPCKLSVLSHFTDGETETQRG